MDLDDDLKFALNCEIDDEYRRTDAIRSSLLQLHALRGKIETQSFVERQRDLMQEYAAEVDKRDGNDTFMSSARTIARKSTRPIQQSKWNSLFCRRLKEGMSPADLIVSLNPNLQPMIELSSKFKQTYRDRLLPIQAISTTNNNHNGFHDSQNDISSTPPPLQPELIQNKTDSSIENQTKSIVPMSPESKLSVPNSNSPTRVPGIFRKKGFQPPKTIYSGPQNSNRNCRSVRTNGRICSSKVSEPPVKHSTEVRKSAFSTGLEEHLKDQVVNNGLETTEAWKILNETRQNMINMKNATKKMKSCVNGGDGSGGEPRSENSNPLLDDPRLKGIEPQMIEMIQNEIITNLDNTDWAHIAGLDYAKSKIKQIAILPLKRPDLFTGIRSPPKGILLFGPPGTGKTMIGRCIATQANATFFSITSSTLTSKWIGDGEKAMKTLFAVARCLKPSVVFIDEVDSLLKSRCDSEHESSRRMKTEFLSQFDGLSSDSNDGLLVIGTTNRPQELDEAVRRRFAARLHISLPEAAARRHMIVDNLRDEKHSLTDEQVASIAEKTEGYSGSDMKHLCREAAMCSFKEVIDELIDIEKDAIREIRYDDFCLALNTVKPSFSSDDLAQYEEWNRKYGSDH